MAADRMTRFEGALVEAAADEGRRENRSARQQLEHWTRLGMELSGFETASRRRMAAAVRGQVPISSLPEEERLAANIGLDVAIRERARAAAFGRGLLAHGIASVALDESGALVEYQPDGTSRPLDERRRSIRPG